MASWTKDDFLGNLPKVYGLYTGGFVVFIILMAILELLGAPASTIGLLFEAFTVVIYAAIGYLSRTMQVDAYYVAGREVPPVFNGMATAADWMSGASFAVTPCLILSAPAMAAILPGSLPRLCWS